MKKILKEWNLYEIIFLVICLLTLTICFIFVNEKNWLSYINSLLITVTVLMVAKGLSIAPVICLIQGIFYAGLAFTQRYFGESIIYLFIMTPVNIYSIFEWFKNRKKDNKDVVEVNEVGKREYIILFILTIIATFGFYFLLKILNTSELIVSTFSLVTSALGEYLILRRSSYYAFFFLLNDIVLIILWSLSVYNFGFEYLPSVLGFCFCFICDFYGLIHWKKEEKSAKISENNS